MWITIEGAGSDVREVKSSVADISSKLGTVSVRASYPSTRHDYHLTREVHQVDITGVRNAVETVEVRFGPSKPRTICSRHFAGKAG